MRDINFFQSYVEKPENNQTNNLIIFLAGAIILVLMIVYPLGNSLKLRGIDKEVSTIEKELGSSETYEKIKAIDEKKASVEEMTTRLNALKSVDSYLNSIDKINDLLIHTIIESVPEDVYLRSFNISPQSIQLQAISRSKEAIAKFQYMLDSIDGFYDIFIPNISKDGEFHQFSVSIKIRGLISEEMEGQQDNEAN